MSKAEGSQSELGRAAEAVERGLARLEELSASVCKMRLHSEKSIARATRELEEALAQPERLADGLRRLAEADALKQRIQALRGKLGMGSTGEGGRGNPAPGSNGAGGAPT